MLELETFQNVSKRGKFDRSIWPTINNIAVQIYDKSLESGESIWHLASPAGGVSPDKVIYFMGFDVSRAPERRKEAAAYAAVCDSYGKILYRKAIDSHKGEKIHAKVLSDWFWDVASSTFDEVKSNERLDELILFKDGPIPSNQIMDYRNGAIDAKERLVAEEIMKNDGNIRVISVTKSGPYRIYGNEQYEYKTQNTAIIRSESMALAITARAARGTPNAFRLEIEYQIKEDTQIDTILQIFNDLRYLDWSSLYMQPKMILPLHIVQNLAKLSKEDILVPYIPR
jgi:argonaute-like protein implicated in RNA metabolism and viral defense